MPALKPATATEQSGRKETHSPLYCATYKPATGNMTHHLANKMSAHT